MKKQLYFLLLGLTISAAVSAQIGSVSFSEFIPESQSVTSVDTYNPDFANSFVFLKCHGATIFSQKIDISLVDSKTFEEKKKFEAPDFKGYDNFSVNTHQYIEYSRSPYWNINADLNQNLLLFYKRKQKKSIEISALKITESFIAPTKPNYLFSISDNSTVKFFKNDKKDLCIFTFQSENKKQNTRSLYYRVYNQELKLLKSDSIVTDYKKPDTLHAMVYDKGYAVIRNKGKKISVSIFDLSTNKTNNVEISNGKDLLTVEKIKSIASDNLVIFGKYSSVQPNKKIKCGFFKVVYNPGTSAMVDQVFFNHVPAGKGEEEKEDKYVERVIITETGACYALISQFKSEYHNKMTEEFTNKFELVYISSNTEKWKRQFPIYETSDKIGLIYSNGYLYVAYPDVLGKKVKINYNNYVYGEHSLSFGQSEPDISLLKISSAGDIQQQSLKDIPYQGLLNCNNEFVGIYQGKSVMVQSKRKFFKITLTDK